MATEQAKQINALRTELDSKLRWMARYGGENAAATSKVYFEIAELSKSLGSLYAEKSNLDWCKNPGDCRKDGGAR